MAEKNAGQPLDARARIELLLDAETFREIGAGVRDAQGEPEAVLTGSGRIDGQLVYVFAQQRAVHAGSMSRMHARKVERVLDMALASGVPVLGIYDSAGARLEEGAWALDAYGSLLARCARLSGVVPQIALVLGDCAGSASFLPALSDFILLGGKGALWLAGPQVVEARTGVGAKGDGAAMLQSGAAHFAYETEEEAIRTARRLIGLLPANNMENPPLYPVTPGGAITGTEDALGIIEQCADSGNLLEVQKGYAAPAVTALGTLEGVSVGFVGAQGVLDESACDKIARFVRLCDAFDLPVVTFCDSETFAVKQEHAALLRAGARLVYAYAEATCTKVTVLTGAAIGGAFIALGSRSLGADLCYAWPQAQVAPVGVEAMARILFESDIQRDGDVEAACQRVRREYTGVEAVEATGLIDAIIRPEETRIRLADAIQRLASKRESRPDKKHGNLPL